MFIHVFYKGELVRTLNNEKKKCELIIGRAEDCDISLSFDSLISRTHAAVTLDDGRLTLEDKGSKNGVFIGKKKVQREEFSFEKRLFMGNSSIVISKDLFKEIKKTIVLDQHILEKVKKGMEGGDSEKALSFLYRISMHLGQYKNEKEMVDDIFDEIMETFSPGRIILFDVIKKNKDVAVKFLSDARFLDERRDFSRTVVSEILKTREAVFIQNVMKEIPDAGKSIRSLGVNSLIAVPLISGKDFLSILQIEFFQSGKAFQEQDFYIVCVLCQMLSGFLKSVRTIGAFKRENIYYKEQLDQSVEIIGEDKKTERLKKAIAQVSKTSTTVLITGESGTGKELVARAVHRESTRKGKPFLVINCAAIPANLIESELFGHAKGAFTGADKSRVGKLEAAGGGTVFLDEIGDMSMVLQTRLLRFLESGEIQPVGSNDTRFADVRVIAATNRDLRQAVKENQFRKDLFFRLSVFQIDCPPLRERGKDILHIAAHYLKTFSVSMGKTIHKISPAAEKILTSYPWPGNIRELKNIMERACVVGEGDTLSPDFLPEALSCSERGGSGDLLDNLRSCTLAEVEKQYIIRVLAEQEGNKAQTASVLGITRKTLYTKLKEYGIHG